MEFNQQENNQNSIIVFKHTDVKLAHMTLKTPCFVSVHYAAEVDINTLEAINKVALFPLASQDGIDLLIVGTGKSVKFLTAKQQIDLQQMDIGVESMNSEAACRSFNLLLSDARSVGLLLL